MPKMKWAAFVLSALFGTHAAYGLDLDDEDLSQAYGDKSTISLATGTKQSLRRAPAVATAVELAGSSGASVVRERPEKSERRMVPDFSKRIVEDISQRETLDTEEQVAGIHRAVGHDA